MEETFCSGIHGVEVYPLKQIVDERGAVLHMLRSDSGVYTKFGEVYFSETNPGVVKAWKRHKKMTQHFAVPVGGIKLVIYDGRESSPTRGRIDELIIGRPDNYVLVKVPPGLWYGFQCISKHAALMANCADLPHDPEESEAAGLESGEIPYNWGML